MLTKMAVVPTKATTAQTIPAAEAVTGVWGLAGGATAVALTTYTVQASAPASADEVQFTGKPGAPSKTLTFDAALTDGGLVLVEYVPVGGAGAAA